MDKDQKREALLNMLDSEGWKLVEKYIADRIEDHEKQLLHCPLDDVTKHRERHQALMLVIDYIKKNSEVN
ncbi:hypothetical protein CVD25_01055 [Bacillus canaveralius]|uniref:Uncharacterized protein n=1 Tax=Bacillus canaveralius TaxID=1403243 RepID=A0A2N5GPM1_9BACI|nr:hypothetical protein [Bacillus canaveralius]PLR84653.1 hypothetical protein CU635_06165 [Bacillus canaveralius]PLS00805.1 hypothetical protein CVD25_01055 [Bacillus canaveralius]